jgi:formylglycine-generating enzyme required for sulfatase activity
MPSDLAEQRRAMLRRMRALGAGSDDQLAELEKIIFASKHMGQGNPAAVEHPMTRSECVARRKASGVRDEIQSQCGAPFMTPLYDPARQEPSEARVCIDRYEFPGLPCEYPVTWVSTKEAQKICKTLDKRLCDAHEWEGACAGALRDAEDEYTFGRERKYSRGKHNQDREVRWAYGDKKDHARCATGSRKSKECGSGWRKCGSNTYPTGSFPECKSPLGVYDQHGNVAEHMSLPLVPKQLGREGGFGEPEMKGSWFVFQQIDAHIDDCRWRAPSWHDNEGTNHANYHLGFRCCKDIPAK